MTGFWQITWLIPPGLLLGALAASAFVSALLSILVMKGGPVDIPRERGAHSDPTPTSGGLAIMAASALVIGLTISFYGHAIPGSWRDGLILFGFASLMGICGAVDDVADLPASWRLASGVRAAASHTGALAVTDTVFDAVIRQFGVLRARNEEQMLDMLEALAGPRAAQGSGLGIATQSGGAGVMMADRAEEVGLTVPTLSPETQKKLATVMPAFGAAGNPVDVTGEFVARPQLLTESVVALMDDPNVHVGIVWLQLMTAHVDKLVSIFTEIRDRTTKPVFVCWVAAPAEALQRLRDLGIVVFSAGERAVEAAAALVRYNQFLRQASAAMPALPPARIPDLVARVLAARGVAPASAPEFLDPTLRALMPDPSRMTDMDKAAARLADAVQAGERIAIFGDYDVDGAASSALLARLLRQQGLDPALEVRGWMQRRGLEWLFRLGTEPRRLWRRYLGHNPMFVIRTVAQLTGLGKYPVD